MSYDIHVFFFLQLFCYLETCIGIPWNIHVKKIKQEKECLYDTKKQLSKIIFSSD